jgi:hypothetical protein
MLPGEPSRRCIRYMKAGLQRQAGWLAAARTCVMPQHAWRHHARQNGALCQVGTQRAQHERQVGMAAGGVEEGGVARQQL